MPESVYFDMVRTPRGGWSDLTCKEWLFWPALCYRVVAPEAKRHEANLFERSVLGFVKAKVVEVEIQANLLGLDTRLIETIQMQLVEEGLLESPSRVSEKGLDLLQSAYYESEQLVTGYVFQDPYTGALWDRFVEDPRYANVEVDGCTRTLIRGVTGRPFKTRAFAQHHPRQLPASPSHADVCRAIRRFQRSLDRVQSLLAESKLSESEFVEMPDELVRSDDTGLEEVSGAKVTRVTFLDSAPVPCFLTTCLYSRSTVPLPSTLLAADPFIQGASDRLMRQILDLAEEHRESPLAEMLNRVFERTHETGLSEFRAQIESLRLRAERKVEEQLGFDNRELAIFEPLARMERAFLEADALGATGDEKLLEGIANARTVLEVLFKATAIASNLNGIERHVELPVHERSAERVQGLLERAAKSLGLQLPLPRHLTGRKALETSYGRIRRLSRNRHLLERAGLRDLFEVCLLGALGHPEHPFAIAVRQASDFGHRTFDIADDVNAAAHGSIPEGLKPKDLCDELYALLQLMLTPTSKSFELT